MAFITSEYNTLLSAISGNPALKQILWSKKIQIDTRNKNVLRDMIGKEGSGKPIIEKTDLEKGQSETVIFVTEAGIGGQGILGENQLKTNTAKHRWNSFQVRVDLIRQGISYTQVVKQMSLMGTTIEMASSELLGQWSAKKDEDDLQVAIRRAALMGASQFYGNYQYNYPVINTSQSSGGPNLYFCGGASSMGTITSECTLQMSDLTSIKSLIQANGASPAKIDIDPATGAQIERYNFIAPEYFLSGMKTSSSYMQALREGDVRGKDNKMWTGRYADINGTVVMPHNVKIETTSGRLGSPWMPVAYLGTATADNTLTVLTGGGSYLPAATGQEYDFFANFPGYPWVFTTYDTAVGESGTWYAMIYNLSSDKKYEIVSYANTGFGTFANTLTVVRGIGAGGDTITGNNTASTAGRFSLTHPLGAIIIPCNILGVPIMFGAMLGEKALCYAKGKFTADPIEDYEDFRRVLNQDPMVKNIGIQSIRGMSAFQDSNGRIPNLILAAGAAPIGYLGCNPVVV